MAKRRIIGPRFEKLDHEHIRALRQGTNMPTLDYSWRRGAETNAIPSLGGSIAGSLSTPNIMDPVSLAKESEETRNAIISKSKRIAPAYNKGANQFLSDETDLKTIGRK